ncbi:PAS domain-containing protein [Dankookia sp. P2]|uniref:PAS domain-containing protein n=1 Tax=Dankookia sp. P2 TaxID=3423955 RepID=UPI003D6784AE
MAGAMLLVLAPDGTVRAINRRGLEVLGLERDSEAIGRDWIATFIPARIHPEVRPVFAALATGMGEPAVFGSFENPVLRADGTERLVSWRNATLRDAAGAPAAVVASGEDITEARAAERHQRLLAREVDHRAKNVLAVVQSILRLTPARDPAAFRTAVEKRIAALRSGAWVAGRRAVAVHRAAEPAGAWIARPCGAESAIRLHGPPLPVASTAAQAVAMLVHGWPPTPQSAARCRYRAGS